MNEKAIQLVIVGGGGVVALEDWHLWTTHRLSVQLAVVQSELHSIQKKVYSVK